jgi:ribosomal protein S18 acetylase RimI-like enzyme
MAVLAVVTISVRQAELGTPADANDVVTLLNTYANDVAGGGEPLSADVRQRLIPALIAHPTTLVLLAYSGATAVGIAVCFIGFSTFHAKPLLNVHDLAVHPAHRGKGLGRALLAEAEAQARQRGCCKLTLEVQDNNNRARVLYARFGFTEVVVNNAAFTRFMAKPLPST